MRISFCYTIILQVFVLHHFQSQHRHVGVQAELPANLFADGKSASTPTTAPSSVVVRLYSKTDQIQTVGDSTTRQGKGGMMMMSMSGAVMKTAPPSLVPSVAPSTTTLAPQGKGGIMSKKTQSPSSSYAPSASIHPTDGKGKGGGMMMMMMSMSPATQSPSVSNAPSASLYPTDSKGKGGGMMMSKSKDTFSPTVSAAPSLSLYPTQEKGMSKKPPPPKDKTPPPTVSLAPTTTAAPTKKMKIPKTKFPTPSPAPSDSIQPTAKGGMMMNMKDGMSPSMMTSKKASDAPAALPETLSPSPVAPTAPAPSPAGVTMNSVRLTPYSLRYFFNQTRVPQDFEVTDVEVVTQMYLADFFETKLPDIMEFRTNATGSAFVLLQPFLLNYTSTAFFEASKPGPLPPVTELDLLLNSAFVGPNLGTYIDLLQGLPPENVFRTTSNVTFLAYSSEKNGTTRSDNEDKRGRDSGSTDAKRTGGIVAGASVFLLLILAVGLHYQKSKRESPPVRRIGIAKRDPDDDDEAHMTIAGDTYMAESTVVSGGVLSLLSSRRRRRAQDRKVLLQRDNPVRAGTPVVTGDEAQSLTLPSIASRSDWQRRSSSDSESEEDSDVAIYDTDRLHFHNDPPAYRGALSTDARQGMSHDVLAVRDDMRLPRHFSPIDDIPNDASVEGDDSDSLSVDEDVPMRVIDLIRKFTPSRRCASR